MHPLNNKNRLDESSGIGQENSNEAMQPASQTTKTPWHLRFAPGAILRQRGIIAVLAIATALTPIQTKAAGSGVGAVVEFFLSWAAGETLNAAKNSILATNGGTNKTPLARLSPTAKAVANTAYWLSNSYDYTHKEDEWDRDAWQWTGNWTTTTETASQQRQDNNESLSGTNTDGTAMTQAEAKGHLFHSKASYTHVQLELFTNDYDPKERYINGRPYDGYLEDVWVFARTDRIHWAKLVQLELLKRKYDDRSLYWGHEFEKITYAYDVGSYEMESKFENVTGHAALSQESDNADANDYKGTVKWKYHKVNVDGTTQVEGTDDYSKYDFKSYKPDSSWVEDLCDDHQVLSVEPNINNSARREFQNQEYKKTVFVSGGVPGNLAGGHGWSGWIDTKRIKRVLVQIEN